MIPESEYVTIPYGDDGTLTVVTLELIRKHHTDREVENFGEWIYGQTVVGLPDGTGGIFIWDYERWLRQGMMTEQDARDWD